MAVYKTKIEQQIHCLSLIKAGLTASLAEHLSYCVISGKKLLLYTDTEESAAQLRLYQSVILKAVSISNLPAVESMQVRLIPQPAKQQSISNIIKLPSKKNIDLIRDNLQTIKDDELKLAWQRLSQTLEKLSK